MLSEITSIIEDTSIDSCFSKIASVIKNISIDSCLSLSNLNEVHVSLEDASDISDVVNAFMESSIPIVDEIYVHKDSQDTQENVIESMIELLVSPLLASP